MAERSQQGAAGTRKNRMKRGEGKRERRKKLQFQVFLSKDLKKEKVFER